MSATHRISSPDDPTVWRPFRVEVEPERDVVRVCPCGEVDIATVPAVRARVEELAAAGFRRVLLDLRGVTFLDSSGLHLIAKLDASARADGWSFAIIEGGPEVQRAVETAGLRSRLPFVEAEQGERLDHRRWAWR